MGVYPIHNLKSQACKNEDVSESQSPLHSNKKPINNNPHWDIHTTHTFNRTISIYTSNIYGSFWLTLWFHIPFNPQKLHEVPEIVFSLIKISWMIQFFDFCLVLAMICQFLSKKIFCLASLKVELAYLRF